MATTHHRPAPHPRATPSTTTTSKRRFEPDVHDSCIPESGPAGSVFDMSKSCSVQYDSPPMRMVGSSPAAAGECGLTAICLVPRIVIVGCASTRNSPCPILRVAPFSTPCTAWHRPASSESLFPSDPQASCTTSWNLPLHLLYTRAPKGSISSNVTRENTIPTISSVEQTFPPGLVVLRRDRMGGLGPSRGHRSPAAQLQTSDASAIVKLSEDRGLEDAVKPYGKRKLPSRPFAKLDI